MATGATVFLLTFVALAVMRLKSVAADGSSQGACAFVFLVILAALASAAIAIGLNMGE